ncbi:MAG: hypothetical protein ACOH1Q_04970 [Thiobacillus sp.]
MKIASGLIIRPEPLEKILSGRKTWEMRCDPIHKRETIALIQKGSKAIYGVADIVDSIGPLSREEMIANEAKHRIEPTRLDCPEVVKYRYAWELANVRRLKHPVPYVHKPGQVKFVSLDEMTARKICEGLRD